MRIMRIVLDTCANVEEAIAVFQRVPVWFTHDLWHFYLADSSGARCVIEYTKEGSVEVVHGEGNYLVSTNTPLVEDGMILSLCPRWAVAENALSRGTITDRADLSRLMELISVSHNNPWLERLMPLSYLQRLRTVWTSIYNLDDCSMELHHWQDDYKPRVFRVPERQAPSRKTSR